MVTAVILTSTCLLCAQSLYEDNLKRLTEEHDQAVAAAVEPINRRYQAALEQLLERAIRNKDLEAAVKIKTKLAALTPPSSAPWRKPANAEELKRFLTGTTWKNNKAGDTLTFLPDGIFRQQSGNTAPWNTTGANTFKLWNYDPATLNPSFTQFTAIGASATYTCTLQGDPAEISRKALPTGTPASYFGGSQR